MSAVNAAARSGARVPARWRPWIGASLGIGIVAGIAVAPGDRAPSGLIVAASLLRRRIAPPVLKGQATP